MTAATVTRTCVECGEEFGFERPPSGNRYARIAAALVLRCDPCIDRLEEEDRGREEQAAFDCRLAAASIPPEFRTADFDSLAVDGNTGAFAAARRWSTGDLHGLFLTGPNGVGKTTLAAAATLARLRQVPVRWVLVPALAAQSFGDRRAREEAAAILTGTGGLVLDDLDKVKANDWVAAQLFAAIDSRITAGASLLITSNKTPDQISEKFGSDFGDAIASRINSFDGGLWPMTGPDRRLQ
jgi:DNA replication protein DnaC